MTCRSIRSRLAWSFRPVLASPPAKERLGDPVVERDPSFARAQALKAVNSAALLGDLPTLLYQLQFAESVGVAEGALEEAR
eukprot:9056744-Alexandrium_andersonii.AAC.1